MAAVALSVSVCVAIAGTSPPSTRPFHVLNNTDLRGPPGTQIAVKPGSSADDCAAQCLAMPRCVAVVWNGPGSRYHDRKCGFKCSAAGRRANPGEQAIIVRPGVDKCAAPPAPPAPPPVPKMVPLPGDWEKAVEESQLLFSGLATLGPMPLNTNIGNGFVGATLGCFPRNCGSEGLYGSALRDGGMNCVVNGVMHIAGVYSGSGTRSRRVALPGVHSVWIDAAGRAESEAMPPVEFAGSALDLQSARFVNRTRLPGCGGAVLEQRWFAHRQNRSLLVYEMELLSDTGNGTKECVVQLASCNQVNSTDVEILSHNKGAGVESRVVRTKESETSETNLVTVAQHFDSVPEQLTVTQGHPAVFVAAMRTSVSDEGTENAKDPASAAARDLAVAKAEPLSSMRQMHVKAWDDLRQGRVEVGVAGKPNKTIQAIAAAINSSYYYMLSSIRDDWPGSFGTSPGGLANCAYEGHTFWDSEEWHFPAIVPLYPRLGEAMLTYRSSRLAAAQKEARACGLAGARFPLESGATGENVCAWVVGSLHEIHTTGDVAMAHRLYYRMTRNDTWLRKSWPTIEGCAQFWASRMTESQNRSGQFTVLSDIGSDERAGVISDDAYTNALAGETLAYADWVAAKLGITPGRNWSQLAGNMYLPISLDLFPAGPVHAENREYRAGQIIAQSDVGLLQYPLDLDFDQSIKHNDLVYYTAYTDSNGFYTGDSSYAIAWMALGNRTGCDLQFMRAFRYMNGLPGTVATASQYNPFNVWKERMTSGGHLNFLTGAGGFLQNVVQGFAGLRARSSRLDFQPELPPFTDYMRLVGLHYSGTTFTLYYNTTTMVIELLANDRGDAVALNCTSGSRHAMQVGDMITLARERFSLADATPDQGRREGEDLGLELDGHDTTQQRRDEEARPSHPADGPAVDFVVVVGVESEHPAHGRADEKEGKLESLPHKQSRDDPEDDGH